MGPKLGAMPSLGRAWVPLLLCCACGRSSKPNDSAVRAAAALSASSPSNAAASALAIAAPSSSAPHRSELRVGHVTTVEAARQLLNDWNTALNAHDVAALEKLYAARVSFYGRSFTRAQVIGAKHTALAASPAFEQQLSDIRIAPEPNDAAGVTFAKASRSAKTVRGRLTIQPSEGGLYAIATETDAPSEVLANGKEGCEAAMYAVALALPEVKKELANATPDSPSGGLSYPTEGTHYSLALGFNHPDRFESVFFVDWLNGAFSVSPGGGDKLSIPAAALARIKAACPK
jgi:hypothetical protein